MNSKYWEEEIETMPREQLRQLQLQRLKKTIAIAANSPFYKKVFQENNITADSINSHTPFPKDFNLKSSRFCHSFDSPIK